MARLLVNLKMEREHMTWPLVIPQWIWKSQSFDLIVMRWRGTRRGCKLLSRWNVSIQYGR